MGGKTLNSGRQSVYGTPAIFVQETAELLHVAGVPGSSHARVLSQGKLGDGRDVGNLESETS